MRPTEMKYLIGTQICGERVRPSRRLCLLAPDHDGDHSDHWPIRPLTREERLERQLAKERYARIRRGRHIGDLRHQIASRDERIAWMSGYIGFRIEYRIRGFGRRLRRYCRFTVHRTIQRRSWKARRA